LVSIFSHTLQTGTGATTLVEYTNTDIQQTLDHSDQEL
jgi:hypothetical protein